MDVNELRVITIQVITGADTVDDLTKAMTVPLNARGYGYSVNVDSLLDLMVDLGMARSDPLVNLLVRYNDGG